MSQVTSPTRALFLNEGALGEGIMGHPRVEAAIQMALQDNPDIDPRFCRLPPMGPVARLAVRSVPVLGDLDLDLQPVRWHLVQAARSRRRLRAALADHRADVVHVHSHTIGMGMVKEMRSVPTFLSVDAGIREWRAIGSRRRVRPYTDAALIPSLVLERRAFQAAATVLAWTKWAAAGVRRRCPNANVVEHHPGIDLQRFRPGKRESRSKLRVLFVGGDFVRKGGPELLAAVEPLLGRFLELDVVTPSATIEQPGVRVHRLSSGDPRLIELYQQANLFCLPTHGDAAPWAVIEAMACGTPVVATRVGGVADLVGHEEGGLLVSPREREELSSAIQRFLDYPSLAGDLGERARARCEERYDGHERGQELIEMMRQQV